MSLTINSDSDGVVYQFTERLFAMAQHHFRREEPYPELNSWDLGKVMGLDEAAFWDFFHLSAINGVFRTGEVVPGSIEALRSFIKKGHRVRIVTNKHLRDKMATYRAHQDMVGFYYDHDLLSDVELVFAHGRYDKQGYPADVVIDDKPTLKWVQKDALNILYDQPWNREVELTEHPYIVRVFDWAGVREAVNREARERKNAAI